MTENNFWKIIEKMNWKIDNNYKRISKELKEGKYGDNKTLIQLLNIFQEKINILNKKVKKMTNEEYIKYINLGDDGLSDVIAHIIGSGKKSFDSVLENNKNFKIYSQNYKESFSYSFQDIYEIKEKFNKKGLLCQ